MIVIPYTNDDVCQALTDKIKNGGEKIARNAKAGSKVLDKPITTDFTMNGHDA